MSGKADGTIYIDTAIEKDGFTAGGNEVVAACRRIAEKVKMIGRTASASFQKQINSFEKQNLAYAQQEKKVEALRKKLEELNNTRVETPEFAEVSKQIEQARAKLARLEKAQEDFLEVGGKTNSKAYKRRQLQIEELRNEIRYAKGEQEDLLNSGKAYTTPDTSTAEEQLRQEEEKLYSMHQRLGTSYESLKAKAAAYEQKVNALARTLRLFNAGANLAVKGIKKMGSVLKNWIKKIKSANKETKRYRMSMGKMLASSILLSTVFHGISNVTEGIKSGFENLAQYSDSTNRSISSMMSALTRLKNSFATAFEPIFTVVAPIITSFINMLSKAITYIGMFFAALTGQKTFKQAKAVQEDYAAGLNDTTSATNDAADAQKDLNEANNDYLSGLDEIHKFETDSSSSGSSGGGSTGGSDAGGVSIGDMFEEVPIDSTVSGIVDKIKEAFAKEDWQGLGKWMADGINTGVQKIYDALNKPELEAKLKKFSRAFTTWFNALVDGVDFNKIGRTIGSGLNLITHTINEWFDGMDFPALGKKLSNGLKGLMTETDWYSLGKMLGNGFMTAWNILDGFISDMSKKDNSGLNGWEQLGQSLAETLNGLTSKINFKTIASALTRGINGAFTALYNFTTTFDWGGLADNIANGIATAIHGTKWKENGKKLGQFLDDLCDTLIDLIDRTDWEDFGKGLADFLAEIPWKKLLKVVAKAIVTALGGLLKGLASTPAGIFADALIVYFLSKKFIAPIANALSVAFTSKTITENLTGALTSMLSSSISGISIGSLGLVALAVGMVVVLVNAIKNAYDEYQNMVIDADVLSSKFAGAMQNSSTNWSDAVSNASGYLSSFNDTMFASSSEIEALETNMSAVQNGITTICRTASDERRDYTAQEIEQLDEYFDKLNELNDEQYNVQKSKMDSISQLAKTYAEQTDTSYEDYKTTAAEWIATATEQKETMENLIDEQTISELALLQQRYGSKATMDNAEYASEYNALVSSGEEKKKELDSQLAEIYSAYSTGMTKVSDESNLFYTQLSERIIGWTGTTSNYLGTMSDNVSTHLMVLNSLKEQYADDDEELNKQIAEENERFANNMDDVWSTLLTGFDEGRASYLSTWLQMVADTEMHGGELDETTKYTVETLLSYFDDMPDKAKETMKDTITPMLEGLQSNDPDLYDAAASNGNSIIAGLEDTLDIHSPSKVMETLFGYVGEGALNGIESMEDVVTALKQYYNDMKAVFVNAVSTFRQYGVDIAQSLASGIQSVHIPTPTLALAGYSNYGVGTSKISMPQFKLSYLASGAVIPPNKEFMAVLGDQKHGTNIETPENLLRKIIREEIGNRQSGNGGNYTFVGQINRRTLFEEVISEAKLKQSISGRNPFDLG